MSRLSPKHSAVPRTKVLRLSGLLLSMICRPDVIMKHTTNTTIAPATGAGMIDRSALSFGDSPNSMNNPPAAKPITRDVAPDAPLSDTLLDEVSDATPPSRPEIATQIPSAIRPFPIRRVSGFCQLSSLTFSHMTRLPNDFNAPQIDTITKVGNSDQRKLMSNMPSSAGSPIHGACATCSN